MPNELDRFKKKGLPEYIPIDKTKYTGEMIPQPKPETESDIYKRTVSLAGFPKPIIETPTKVAGLPETTTPFSEAKKRYNEALRGSVISKTAPTEEYVSAAGGTTKPYGYPEEGKVYTETDLGQPMTRGGFGYVPRGLPETRTPEDYFRETITKMQDRAEKLALDIESGFAKGKRQTGSFEELKSIHATLPLLMAGLAEAGVGAKTKEAEIGKTEAEKTKLERETAGLPRTPEEAKSFLEAKTTGDITAKMGLVKQYQAAYTKINSDILLSGDERAAQIEALNEQYRGTIPEYLVGENEIAGLPSEQYIGTVGSKKYYRSKAGKILVEE